MLLKPDVRLIFTGDFIDRGNQNLRVIETMIRLKSLNPQQVTQLFGNHELLALSGLDTARSISLKPGSVDYDDYLATPHGYNGGIEVLKELGETPREAFSEYTKRFSRDGDIGSWMRELEPLKYQTIKGKKILFVHGGIPTRLASPRSLEDYIALFEGLLRRETEVCGGSLSKYLKNSLVGSDSIFWDRSISLGNRSSVENLPEEVGADYIVIGHTPVRGKIEIYGERIFNIDVGMSPKYGEHDPAAIVFDGDGVFGLYADAGRERLN